MTRQWERSPVVVGVDGSLTARPWPEPRERPGLTTERADHRLLADADAVLAEAAELAEEIMPRRSVTTVTAIGWPAAALVEESRHAALLVLGARGPGGCTGPTLGSVGVEVTAHAKCPVVVVRGVA